MSIPFETDQAVLEQLLIDSTASRVLDIATGRGDFLIWIMEMLKRVELAVGIDEQVRPLRMLKENHADAGMKAARMDAARLGIRDGSFDLVCVSQSLHHVPDPQSSLKEMVRVVRRGGMVVVREMYADHQTGPQQMHVDLHHWWAAVDTARGVSHRNTYPREELAGLFLALNLPTVRLFELAEPEGDPLDPATIEKLDAIIQRYQGMVDQIENGNGLKERGHELRERLHAVGFQGAAQLVMLGWTS